MEIGRQQEPDHVTTLLYITETEIMLFTARNYIQIKQIFDIKDKIKVLF
jgi:hypothetical protein